MSSFFVEPVSFKEDWQNSKRGNKRGSESFYPPGSRDKGGKKLGRDGMTHLY